ncbi:helix-turn-helix transcriptional regulator [Caenispirillum bisanense]|uniref:helix-turn-helix domain-containing protein n=1 Tax=Caenispirillum bisanense TaxID=414052 RepID=UPI0031DD4473
MNDDDIIEAGCGNVYADLDSPAADEMWRKAELARAIADQIDRRGLSQRQAAAISGIPQPKLCNLLGGRFRGISEAKMLAAVARLGRRVEIVIHEPGSDLSPQAVRVTFAP